MAPTPPDRSQIGRIAGLTGWSNTVDRKRRMAKTHAANPSSIDYWVRKVRKNPDFATATDQQVLDAATSMMKLHFTRLAFASAKARRRGGDAA